MLTMFPCNRWDEWVFSADAMNGHVSLWDEATVSTKKPTPMYTNSGKGRGGSSRHKGWSDAGIARFNELVKNVIYDRQTRNGSQFEEALKKKFWDAEVLNDRGSRKRRKLDTLDHDQRRREEPVDFVQDLLD